MPVRFRLPERCPSCAAEGVIRAETTVHGLSVQMMWYCQNCDHEWPITHDYIERRTRQSGRRRIRELIAANRKRVRVTAHARSAPPAPAAVRGTAE